MLSNTDTIVNFFSFFYIGYRKNREENINLYSFILVHYQSSFLSLNLFFLALDLRLTLALERSPVNSDSRVQKSDIINNHRRKEKQTERKRWIKINFTTFSRSTIERYKSEASVREPPRRFAWTTFRAYSLNALKQFTQDFRIALNITCARASNKNIYTGIVVF